MELIDPKKLRDICLRLSKYKKENKEFLTYLLFEAQDEEEFRKSVKSVLNEMMEDAHRSNVYWTKKGVRKALRYLDKVVRFSGRKDTEAELRLHFIDLIKEHGIPIWRSRVLMNIYQRQIVKIKKAMEKLHEDLQYDYQMELEEILTK